MEAAIQKRQIKLMPKQVLALKYLRSTTVSEVLYGGGAGGGKSWLGCYWLIYNCIKYPGTRWVMGRAVLKTLKETTLNSFYDVSRLMGLRQKEHWVYNAQSGIITFLATKSEILLKDLFQYPSDKDFDELGSLEITGAFVDECNQIVEKAWEVLKSRIRYRLDEYGLVPTIMGSCNPAKNWVYRRFYKPYKVGELPSDRKFIPALAKENHNVSKHYVANLQSLSDPASRARLLLGDWEYDNNPNSLCDSDSIRAIFGKNVVDSGDKYIVADIARYGSDRAIISVWDGWRMIEKVVYAISATTEIQACINALRVKHKIPKDRCLADEDGVGCLNENMEVLTTKGWKKAIDITISDTLISKDVNGDIERLNPFKIIHHDEEKFITVDDDLSFTVTHAHFFKTRKEYPIQQGYWDDISLKKRIYFDTKINECAEDEFIEFEETVFKMPNGGVKRLSNNLKIKRLDFYKFLGWFLSEGSLDGWRNKHIIRLTQTSKSLHNEDIARVLKNMGVKVYKKSQKDGALYQYEFQHKGLYDYLAKNCYTSNKHICYNKKMPDDLKHSSRQNILSFCEEFIKGDGYYHKGRMQFVSSSKRMIDDIQEMLFYAGVRTNIFIKQRKGSTSTIEGRVITRRRDIYLLSEVIEPLTLKITKRETSFGRAINIKIPNETRALLVRHKSNIFWTHNGGVVDNCGIEGFENNSSPLTHPDSYEKENYFNLQSQMGYYLAKKINAREVLLDCDLSSDEIDSIVAELEQLQTYKSDSDGKLRIKPKSEIKEELGRSPDWRDVLLMRSWFDYVNTKPINFSGFHF